MTEKIKLFIKRQPFFRGVIRIIDLGCSTERPPSRDMSMDGFALDKEKLAGDWRKVGGDMYVAIGKYEKEHAASL